MGTYQAKRNEVSEIDEPEKSYKEQKQESTEKAVDLAGEVALDYFTGGQGSQIKNAAENVPIVGKRVKNTWDGAVKRVSKVVSKTPVGDMLKKADDAGITDMAKGAKDVISMKGSPNSSGANNIPNSSNTQASPSNSNLSQNFKNSNQSNNLQGQTTLNTENTSSSNASSQNNSDIMKKLTSNLNISKTMKLKIAVCLGLVVMFMLIVFGGAAAQKDFHNLALTNNAVMASSSAGSRNCSAEEIGKKIIYVGDSRTVMLKDALKDIDTTKEFIGQVSAGYSWLSTSAISDLETKIRDNNSALVVFNFGVNDLYNVDNYINFYKNLFEKYPDTKFYIMSVNPVDEAKTSQNGYTVTNQQIEEFNKKISDAFPSQYINSYNNIKSNFETSDGLHYNDETSKKIHEYVSSSISSNSSIICSVGSISSINDSSLGGGNLPILKSGESILSKIGQEKLDAWNASLKSDIQSAGIGSGAAPAMAAYGLIQGALNEGFVIPYFWGGGHGNISDGINGSWGAGVAISASGSSAQPAGSLQPSGLDCSGFVSWALKNAGCTNFSPIVADSFKSLGPSIDASKATVGDIAASSTHVMIILNNTGSELIVAEAKGARYGIVFSKFDYSHFGKYKVVNMSDYYSKNCNG